MQELEIGESTDFNKINKNEREKKMYTTQQQYERIKIEILRGVDSYLIGFENETKVMSALEAIDRYNNESNEFLKESMLLAYQSASKFIDDWKQIHIIKADKVIKQKEDEIKLPKEGTPSGP